MEHETFWTLLKDAAHWEFEIFLILIFDVALLGILWPFAKKFFKRIYTNNPHHISDDKKITQLEQEMRDLKSFLKYPNEETKPDRKNCGICRKDVGGCG